MSDNEDFAIMYRPITPSNTFVENSRSRLQNEINMSTGTGQHIAPEPGTAVSQPGHYLPDNTSPLTGITNTEVGPTSSNEASVYEVNEE